LEILLDKGKALKAILAGAGGFTLIELVIAVGILTMATGMIGGALF
jgi:prepilin-type N-terminal cleavage/methylation domain-containing protein